MQLEGFSAFFAIIGLLLATLLPFYLLYLFVRKMGSAVKTKVNNIQLLVPDGQPITGTVTKIVSFTQETGGNLRYTRFEYFDQNGKRYFGEKSSSGESVGDSIELMYLPSDPKVHEEAEVIIMLRESKKSR